MEMMEGGCLCGRIRYRVRIDNDEAGLCHCRMCQRASGNVWLALKEVRRGDVTWRTEPDRYRSSPIAQRGFCATCGTSLTWESLSDDNMDLTVASFDDPGFFRPTGQGGIESRHDGWRDLRGVREGRTEDNSSIVAKWKAADANVPD